MCLITKNPELMALYRQRVAYGQDPVKVSEYVKRLENKRSAGGDATLLKATTSTNRCSANLWNKGDGCRCRFDGKYDATDWEGKAVKVCKNHKNSIDNAMAKYIDWKREYGYICTPIK